MKSVLIAVILCGILLPCAYGTDPGPVISRDEVLIRLRDGNARFAEARVQTWTDLAAIRMALAAEGQHPFACIVTCSDSRVSPEFLFDRSLGDLFVVRLAGNVMTPEAAASVEYAVEHFQVPVVVVLGHSGCGAVKAALTGRDQELKGPMATLLSRIYPAMDAARAKGFGTDELYTATINENARLGTEELLRNSRAIEEAVGGGRLTVLSAVYDLHSGIVNWQYQLMAAVTPVTPAPAALHAEITPSEIQSADTTAKSDVHAAMKTPAKKKTNNLETEYAKRHR